MLEFIFGLLIMFHWSMCLFLCQYHTILIIIAWQPQFEIGKCDSSHFLLFSLDCFSGSGSSVAPYECWRCVLFSVKYAVGILTGLH